jgi:DNA-binding transcriptional ArsR family regulator
MSRHPAVSSAAFLIADPTRATMLMALADGRAQPAGELAYAAGVTAQTASSHLVAVTQALQDRGFISAAADKQFEVTHDGMGWFSAMGLDVAALKPTRRGLARQCLDWTERRHHLAGPLGVELMSRLCAIGWVRRSKSSRAVLVTPKGWAGLKEQLGVDERAVQASV